MKTPIWAVPPALVLLTAPLAAQPTGQESDEAPLPPAASQEEAQALSSKPPSKPRGRSVFSGDWIAVGGGVVYANSYSGSDESRALAVPVIAGNYKGIGVRPRAAGLSFNFLEGMRGKVTFSAGPIFRFRGDRAGGIKDPVVEAAGKLETAFELGGQAGVTLNGVFTRYDRISAGVDLLFDVAGAHGGAVIDPGVSYSTPLGRGTVVAVSLGAQYVDGNFADYYYSVTPVQSTASGLPEFDADSGWHKAGATLAMGFDTNGEFRDGGLIVGGALGYRRMLGDAADTPYTSLRGDADQLFGIFGIAYVF